MSDFATLMEAARNAGIQVSPPVNSETPAVTGNGLVGEVLTCTMGIWVNEPTAYAYMWQSNGVPNAATGATYTVVAGDVGAGLSCVVTATNSAGTGTAPASNVVPVVAASREAAHAPAAHEAAPASRENPTAAAGERNRTRS